MDFYNEIDGYAADWLENLIAAGHLPGGHVDRRSIRDILPDELTADRAHFFAGIGGWPLALRLAGWPATKPVWTGFCPCQSFSAAGEQAGLNDERNLWPTWFSQIRVRRPDTIFGEQVSNAIGFGWLDGISRDLEGEGYTVGACVLGAFSVGAPHIRKRLYWVAHSKDANGGIGVSGTETGTRENGKRWIGSGGGSDAGRLGESIHQRLERLAGNGHGGSESGRVDPESPGSVATPGGNGSGGMADTNGRESSDGNLQRGRKHGFQPKDGGTGFWDRYDLVPCSDGKARRVGPGIQPLAHGVPARVGKLRAAGNAIVPQVAAAFIRAFMEIRND